MIDNNKNFNAKEYNIIDNLHGNANKTRLKYHLFRIIHIIQQYIMITIPYYIAHTVDRICIRNKCQTLFFHLSFRLGSVNLIR